MEIYAFGSNGSGQLGIGHKDDTNTPQRCRFADEIISTPVRVVAGGNSTLVLFASGYVYSAGAAVGPRADNSSPDASQHLAFEKVALTKQCKAKMCSATWEASMIVTTTDKILVRGCGPKGELGLGPHTTVAEPDAQLRQFPPEGLRIVDIASSVSHTVVVLSNGEAYGWGNGRKGQLGEPPDIVWTPRRIESLAFRAVRAVCGRQFTLVVASPADGRFKILGSNKWNVISKAPQMIRDWVGIGAGWGTISVQMEDGRVQSWGRNDRGQVASTRLPLVRTIAIGSEHGVALTRDGEVICWGWGEHGNCGSSIDQEGNSLGDWVTISAPELEATTKMTGLGAGCATSFLCAEARHAEVEEG